MTPVNTLTITMHKNSRISLFFPVFLSSTGSATGSGHSQCFSKMKTISRFIPASWNYFWNFYASELHVSNTKGKTTLPWKSVLYNFKFPSLYLSSKCTLNIRIMTINSLRLREHASTVKVDLLRIYCYDIHLPSTK